MGRIAIPVYFFVLVLVEYEGRYLLIQEAMPDLGNPWHVPAGGVEPGESLVEAAKREAREEAGVDVEPKYLLGVEHNMPKQQGREQTFAEKWRFFFLADYVGGELKTVPDKESLKAGWFRPEEVETLFLRGPDAPQLIKLHQEGKSLLPLEAYFFHRH